MIDAAYIRSVLERLEGKGHARGYVPCDRHGQPLGASGVTVGTGLDLGQQSRASLAALGLPAPLLERLAPYLGARREEALYLLARSPLTLAPDEVAALDAAVQAKYIEETAELFGREGFAAAPRQAQAVAASLHFQFGRPSRRESPGLAAAWSAMQRREYRAAAAALRDPAGWSRQHQAYLTRRQAEAALLEEVA